VNLELQDDRPIEFSLHLNGLLRTIFLFISKEKFQNRCFFFVCRQKLFEILLKTLLEIQHIFVIDALIDFIHDFHFSVMFSSGKFRFRDDYDWRLNAHILQTIDCQSFSYRHRLFSPKSVIMFDFNIRISIVRLSYRLNGWSRSFIRYLLKISCTRKYSSKFE